MAAECTCVPVAPESRQNGAKPTCYTPSATATELKGDPGGPVPFETMFLSEHEVLMIRVLGVGDSDLVQQMVAAIRSAPEFQPGMSVLIDAFGTDYLPSTQEATTFPAVFQAQLPGSRIAVVVRAGGQYNVSAVVEAIATRRNIPFAAFSSRDDAMKWLTGKR